MKKSSKKPIEPEQPKPEPSQADRVRDGLTNWHKAKITRDEANDRGFPYDTIMPEEAAKLEEAARNSLELNEVPVRIPGGEIVVQEGNEQDKAISRNLAWHGRRPTIIAAKASQERMILADNAGVLAFAMDAVEGIKNPTALEKMLIHQMAAVHRLAMRLIEKANQATENISNQLSMNYAQLLIGQATRLMNTYQSGMQSLVKSRSGGKQTVTVQHIHVTGDAQAVVAGKMEYPTGGLPGGGNPR